MKLFATRVAPVFALLLLTVLPAAGQTLEGQVVGSGDMTVTYTLDIGQPANGGLLFIPWQMQINALDFAPGSVIFAGQPVDFDGTEASFLASVYQGVREIGSPQLPPFPIPFPTQLGGIGGLDFFGPAGQGGGALRLEGLQFGPNLGPGFFPLQNQPYLEAWRFEFWDSPVVPELNGHHVSWLMDVDPFFVDPNQGIVQANVQFEIYAIEYPILSNFELFQYAWIDENGVLQIDNSSWALLEFDLTLNPVLPFYLNLVGDAGFGQQAWLIQNLPLLPPLDPLDPLGPPRQGVDLDLTQLLVPPGTAGLELQLQAVVTQQPLPFQPPLNDPIPVPFERFEREASGSKFPGSPPQPDDVGEPSGVKANGKARCRIRHKKVPAVQEDTKACLAGAFARSISWLNSEYELGVNKTAQQIYDDLRGLNVGSTGPGATTYEQDVAAKAKYLQDNFDKGAQTKVLDLGGVLGPIAGVKQQNGGDLIAWLKKEMKTEDVELHYDKHIVTVTEYWEVGEGANKKVFIKYRDDEKQNDDDKGDTSEKTAELRNNGDGTYSFRQNGTIKFFEVQAAVSESVPIVIAMSKAASGDLELRLTSTTDTFDSADVVSGPLSDLASPAPFACSRNAETLGNPGDVLMVVPPSDAAEFFLVRNNSRNGATSSNALGLGQSGDRDARFDCPECAHSPCDEGEPLDPACDFNLPGQVDATGCVDAVCSVFPSCCDLVWDAFCVEQASGGLCTVCP